MSRHKHRLNLWLSRWELITENILVKSRHPLVIIRIVLHIFHHFLKARPLKVRTGVTVVHEEHGVFEAVIGSVAGEQIFLRLDLSRGIFLPDNANYL